MRSNSTPANPNGKQRLLPKNRAYARFFGKRARCPHTRPGMNPKIHRHLELLYSKAAASHIAPELQALIDRRRPTSGTADSKRSALTQLDVVLITYADQVREPDVPPLLALAGFSERYLRPIISGIHILPFYPWSSDDGFSVKDFFEVDPAFGTWDDVSRLGRSFDLMFDAVINHMSAQSDWFQRFLRDEPDFRGYFFTVQGRPDLSQVVRPRALPLLTEFQTARGPEMVWTTFSADQVDLDFRNPRVLLAVLDALLFYASKGARFIRLDAIAYLWKEIGTPCIHLPKTHRLIQLMRAVLDEAVPRVLLITETNVPHTDNISYFGDGSNEAQLVYNFALPPLVLQALATGNAAKLSNWAATLSLPSGQTAFFNFLASHDGIGLNPARGILSEGEIAALVQRALDHGGLVSYKNNSDGSRSPYELNITYFDALSDPKSDEPIEIQINRFLVAHAIMLALAGVPGIYFHSLFGSRNDRAGAETSGIARRINRQKLDRAQLEMELADRSSLRAQVFERCRELLEVRRRHACFCPGFPQQVLPLGDRVFAVLRSTPDASEQILCLQNVSHLPVNVPLRWETLPASAAWTPLLHSAGPQEQGIGFVRQTIELAPFSVCWLKLQFGQSRRGI
jgi:glucosylglycerate phosphorylase